MASTATTPRTDLQKFELQRLELMKRFRIWKLPFLKAAKSTANMNQSLRADLRHFCCHMPESAIAPSAIEGISYQKIVKTSWPELGCFRNLVLLAHFYLQQTKWLILYLPHFRTAKAISSSNIVKIIGLCRFHQQSIAEAPKRSLGAATCIESSRNR